MSYAPIALFTYNRPQHTLETLQFLMANPGFAASPLHVFSDGPKYSDDMPKIMAVRQAVRNLNLPNLTLHEREANVGLFQSIVSGVSALCEQDGRVIVIEDDLRVAPYFLNYMNTALDRYADAEQVMQVSGYMFPADLATPNDTVFLPFTTTLGWATWQRAWQHFDSEAQGYAELKRNRVLRRRFDLDGAYPYFRLLEKQRRGKVHSWGICWYLSVFLRAGLTLHPTKSAVQNFGFDGTGTHSRPYNRLMTDNGFDDSIQQIGTFPDSISIDQQSMHIIRLYLKRNRRSILGTLFSFLWRRP